MKKILFAVGLLGIHTIMPMRTPLNMLHMITMPNKGVLTQRLLANGHDSFVEKTKIVDRLAGKEKHVTAVLQDVETSLGEYREQNRQVTMSALLQMKKQLVETLFQDNPNALQAANEYSKPINK